MADANASATPINGKDGTADVTISTISYKWLIRSFRLRERVEMTNADVFAIEGQADQEPGRSQLNFEIAGVTKKGTAQSGPLMPAPQNVPMVFTVSTGCTVSGNFNFEEATLERATNQLSTFGGTGMSKKAYVIAWQITTP